MVTGGGGEDLRKLFLSLPLVCRGKKSPPESLLVKVVEMDVLFFFSDQTCERARLLSACSDLVVSHDPVS